MALQHSPSIVTSGLILCLDAGNPRSYGGSGALWTDIGSSGTVATLANSPTYTSGVNGYFTFNGTNNTASIPYTTLLDPTVGITIECWVYPTSITSSTYQELFRKENGSARQLFSFQDTGTILSFGTHTTGNGYDELDVSIASGNYVNQWIHIVASYTSGSKVIYRNGVEIGSSSSITGSLVQGDATYYVGSASGSGEWFIGRYAVCKMYSYGLSSTQVLQNFNALRGRYGV
jgi:hypothetical protein